MENKQRGLKQGSNKPLCALQSVKIPETRPLPGHPHPSRTTDSSEDSQGPDAPYVGSKALIPERHTQSLRRQRTLSLERSTRGGSRPCTNTRGDEQLSDTKFKRVVRKLHGGRKPNSGQRSADISYPAQVTKRGQKRHSRFQKAFKRVVWFEISLNVQVGVHAGKTEHAHSCRPPRAETSKTEMASTDETAFAELSKVRPCCFVDLSNLVPFLVSLRAPRSSTHTHCTTAGAPPPNPPPALHSQSDGERRTLCGPFNQNKF